MRAFSEGVASEADFSFVNAPARADGVVGWWRALEEPAQNGAPLLRYDGWALSRDFIAEHCRREGPFDGVLGFSQGATLAGLLVALAASSSADVSTAFPQFGFAILVGGFASAAPEHAALYRADSLRIPSLHLIGLTDNVVPPQRSRALAASFHEPLLVEHPGGHVVPGSADVRDVTLRFLRERRARSPAEFAR